MNDVFMLECIAKVKFQQIMVSKQVLNNTSTIEKKKELKHTIFSKCESICNQSIFEKKNLVKWEVWIEAINLFPW